MPVIYFVRHGETDWNAEGRLQGQRDVPLSDVGRVQAEEVGARLPAIAARPEDLIYVSSPLSRARETMEIMRRKLGLLPGHYRVDERLKEIGFGAWEGFTWKELRRRDPTTIRNRDNDKWAYVPPNGESYEQLAARAAEAVAELDRDAVVVSHGGVARALLAIRGHVSREDAPRVDIWQGRVLVFGTDGFRWE